MLNLDIKVDLKPMHRALLDLGNKQVTFAAAAALTKLAQGASDQETIAVKETFDRPTPFTQRGFRIVPATKGTLASFVLAKDIQAQYLAPYVFGGPRFLGSKRAMLVPKQVGVNQYGNLPRNKLAQLKGRSDIFIGPVKFKSGETINGVWQRPAVGIRRDGARGTKGATKGSKTASVIASANTGLKLLIRFEDTSDAPKHLPFMERARAYVTANARREFEVALRRALATAR
ncbi:MAG: hypothetical protein P4L68_08165 [Methylovirgula sp.]|nr:hypothetical protein [Methylovirgula sp.]